MVVNGHGTGLFLAYGRCGTTCVMNKTRLEDARSIDSSSEEDVEREELQSFTPIDRLQMLACFCFADFC